MSSVRWPTEGANWQSQQLSHSDKRDMKGKSGGKSYSWWWDSHNTPKNSKWLEDNLNDMDAKVKAMLKLIEEDADSFAKRAEMYYKKRPELVSLVEEFYRAYRSLAERYDQLTGHIRQIPQEIQAQFGFSGDASPGSPGSGGSVRRRAAGFSAFLSPGTPKLSKEKARKDGSDSSSSSSSDSDSDLKRGKPKRSDEILLLRQDNEQLKMDLDKGATRHQALESRLAELQEEAKSLRQENVQLHRKAASAHSEIAALEAEIERLKRENRALGEEASATLRNTERLQQELETSQCEHHHVFMKLEETGLTIRDLEAQIKELEGRLLQLSEELSSSTALCEHQKLELDTMRQERTTLQKEVSGQANRILELEEEISSLRGFLSLAESERDRNLELHQTLERDLTNAHIEFSSLKEERGKLSEELLQRVQHVQSVEQQLIEVQEALAGIEREKTEVVGLLRKTESSLADLQNEFHSMQGSLREEISVQVAEKLVFQKQVEELQAALEALHGERTRGVELQDLYERRVVDLAQQLKHAQEALESSEKEKIDLVNRAETQISELHSEFASMQERLNGELSVQSQEGWILSNQVVELESTLEALRGEWSQAVELQETLEKRVTDLELQLKQSNDSLDFTEREKAKVIGDLSRVEKDFLNLHVEFKSVHESLNGKISVQAQEKQVLQSQIEELQAVSAALKDEKCRSLELKDGLEKMLTDYDQQLKQVQAALEQTEREKSEAVDLLSKRELSLSELQEESSSINTRMTLELGALSEEKQILTAQIEELQATLTALRSEKSRGVELQDVLEKRMIELQQELSQAKQEASGLLDSLVENAALVSHLEEAVKTRDEIVSRLEGELLAKQEEGEALRRQLEDSSSELQRLESVLQRLQVLLGESEDLAKSLESKAKDYEQDLELGRIEATRLRTDLENNITIIGKLEGEVQDRNIQLTALQEANSTLEVELASTLQRAQLLELDVKTNQETAILRMEKLAKLEGDLHLESHKAHKAEEKSLLQEQVIFDVQEERARLLARVEELEMNTKALREELEGHLAKIEDLCQAKEGHLAKIEDLCRAKEACDEEILALKDELSKVKLLSEETSSQYSETISSLKAEISKLQTHLASRLEELESFEKEKAGWYLEKAAFAEEINQATKEKEELQKTILMWTQRMENLEMEHTTLKTTSREVESFMLFHQTEHGRVQSELSEKAERIQWLEEELKRLGMELLGSQEASGKLSIELKRVSQELKDQLLAEEEKVRLLHDNESCLQQELSTVKELREGLINSCKEHVQVFKIKEESLESEVLKFKDEIQHLDHLCKELTKKLEVKSNEHEALRVEKQELHETLHSTQLERDSAMTKCDSLQFELAQEHECRVTVEAEALKRQADIAGLLAEIARLQAELQELTNKNKTLTTKLEAALEQERIDAMEIDTLLMALQDSHEENGNSNVGDRSWHFETKHSAEGKPSTLRHLKESMLNLLTDRSRIKQEATAHAEHIKALHFEIEKSGQDLETSRGDYGTLLVKYDTAINDLQSLHLRIEHYESQVHILEEEKRRLHEQLEESELKFEDLKEVSSSISQKYETTLAESENLRSQFSSLQEENGRLGLDVSARTVSVAELTETVLSAERQNADLSAELKTMQENDLLHQEQVTSLRIKGEQLKQTLNSQGEKIQMLEEEVFNLRELHTKLQSDHECISIEKQRSLDEHSLTLLSLEKMKEELVFLQRENDRVKTELKSQSARIGELETTTSSLEKEKQAFSVEIASTVLLMNDVQKRSDDLQEEVNRLRRELISSNEQLQEKLEKIEELSSVCSALQKEKLALSMDLEMKIKAFGSLDANFCALKDEHLSLVDMYEILTEEVTSRANLILKLQEEISQLSLEKEAQARQVMDRKADVQKLQEDLAVMKNSEKQLRELLDVKVQEIIQLEEELDRLKAARLVHEDEHKQNTERLETELKRLESVVIVLRDEKSFLCEQHALAMGRWTDLEAGCKSLQGQVADLHAERIRLEAQLSVIDELKKEMLDYEEMLRSLQERVASKQHEIDQVQSINAELKEITRKFESESENLRSQIIILQKKNTSLNEEVSTKASLVQDLDRSFTSLKEEKVVFGGGFALAVGNVSLVQAEVDKLLDKISKLNELSITTGENLHKMEDRICKLQASNLNISEELSVLAKKEKSYVIAVRFMRAEFFCLAQRVKAMKEEKVEQARLAELAMEAEKKNNGEVLSGLHQELAFLREENKRQRAIIIDRAEEKREAIRQLCVTIDYVETKNRRLEGVISSVRERIQRRIAASGTRRS